MQLSEKGVVVSTSPVENAVSPNGLCVLSIIIEGCDSANVSL